MKPLEDMTEPELKAVMQKAAQVIVKEMPPNTGFILQAATFDGKIAQYISNVDRECAEEWFLETLLRWKRKDHLPRVEGGGY